jgi:hypothetical protein
MAPVFHFPQPTGQYPIGTLTYHWIDTTRSEVFTADPQVRRQLLVQIWYPAAASPSASRAAGQQHRPLPHPGCQVRA